ncbi:MAG: ATP-binding cassette domain-containing protein [Acidobacteriota bacterium]
MSIEVGDIHFQYGRIKALEEVNLNLVQGAIGLLGPNGAGKSTLIRLLLGFLPVQRGEGRVLGFDIRTEQSFIRKYVGYMPEDNSMIPGLDGVTFTSFLGELSGMPKQESMKRAHEVLFYVGLEESRYRKVESYSRGMLQRLKLAQALVHDPRLLFLDEPTSGLDPKGRLEFLELIKDITSKKDIQVLISSHILPDIEETCSHVVILNRGKVAAQGDLNDLKRIRYNLFELKVKGKPEGFLKSLREKDVKVEILEDGLWKVFIPADINPRELLTLAWKEKIQVRHFVKSQSTLEDLFAKVVGVEG